MIHDDISQKLERQSRLFNLHQHQLISKQKVVIVGIGALGQMVAEELVRSGFKEIVLIDDDTISYSNFNRQIHATHRTLQLHKIEATKQKLLEIEPLCHIETYAIHLDQTSSLEMISANSILADCCDNVATKLFLEDVINQKNIPLIHAGIDGWCGRVATIYPGDNLLKQFYKDPNLKTINSLMITVGIVASFQTKEIIQYAIHEKPNLHHKILMINALYNEIDEINLYRLHQ